MGFSKTGPVNVMWLAQKGIFQTAVISTKNWKMVLKSKKRKTKQTTESSLHLTERTVSHFSAFEVTFSIISRLPTALQFFI